MKKILIALLFVLTLSGCERDRSATYSGSGFMVQHDELESVLTNYYPKEEVDEAFTDLLYYINELKEENEEHQDLINQLNQRVYMLEQELILLESGE